MDVFVSTYFLHKVLTSERKQKRSEQKGNGKGGSVVVGPSPPLSSLFSPLSSGNGGVAGMIFLKC